ncbi:hypothetical protein AURDEDRAFT_121200 [Auricularia subglabra TFB-10046 SS5]|nr:hypothetical protein AURDEDRAFT_121200 [Auricularia subglabra TFB-10046 SS5]
MLLLALLLWLISLVEFTRASSSGAPVRNGIGATPPGARLPVSWAVTDVPTQGVYPDNVFRFFTRRWTSPTTSWILPNSPTRGMPLPPSGRGVRPCGCYDSHGRQTSIYGQLENGPMWLWAADWYDPNEPVCPYTANIWEGMGPCARLSLDSVLHCFPTHRQHEGPESWFWVADAARREMEAQEMLDESMLPLLFPAARIPTLPRISSIVYEARFAARALRQGTDATRQQFERLRQQRYFGPCPQGAWFDDVIGSAGIIWQFILEGVPVYYRWEADYETLPFLADLAPPESPLPGSPRFFPPPTPRRPGPGGTPAPGLPRHGDSYRIPPRAATGRDGHAEVMDDMTLHQLKGLDPDRSPPAEVLDEEEKKRDDAGSEGSSTLSWGSSMDYDSYESPARQQSPQSERVPALLRRMSNVMSQADSRERSPDSPTVEMLRRAEAALPVQQPLLSARISSPRAEDNVAQRAVSIFDFLRVGDGSAERGPFVPAPSRRIHPRVPDWGLIVQESADSAAARDYFARREAGELQAATEQLEYAFRRGSAYTTGFEFPRELLLEGFELAEAVPESDVNIHDVPSDFCITRDTPLNQRYYQWARGVRFVLSRPHARAALARGGIIWRIARWAGLTLAHAMDGPTPDVREMGSRKVVIVQGEQGLFAAVDDWLSDDEVNTLLGTLADQAQSVWPDMSVIARNWWQGEWTNAHESWFQESLRFMFANRHHAVTRTRAQFRSLFRDLDYHSNGGARQGRNKAGGQDEGPSRPHD